MVVGAKRVLAIAVSLAENIAAAPALEWKPVLAAGWPPVALLLSVELLVHRPADGAADMSESNGLATSERPWGDRPPTLDGDQRRLEAERTGSSVEAAEEVFVSRSALHRMVDESEVAEAVVAMLRMPGLCAGGDRPLRRRGRTVTHECHRWPCSSAALQPIRFSSRPMPSISATTTSPGSR